MKRIISSSSLLNPPEVVIYLSCIASLLFLVPIITAVVQFQTMCGHLPRRVAAAELTVFVYHRSWTTFLCVSSLGVHSF